MNDRFGEGRWPALLTELICLLNPSLLHLPFIGHERGYLFSLERAVSGSYGFLRTKSESFSITTQGEGENNKTQLSL
jgi:hypothetical protein